MAPGSATGGPAEAPVITVALAGQPNAGKSTVFNLLTGLDQHVGNWPGKTIEKREGVSHLDGRRLRIVDLPGTYALSAELRRGAAGARRSSCTSAPMWSWRWSDASTLERSLYMVAELLWLPAPVVVGLNMMDVAERHGIHIEPDVLETALGVPVVPMVASRNVGRP